LEFLKALLFDDFMNRRKIWLFFTPTLCPHIILQAKINNSVRIWQTLPLFGKDILYG